VLGVAEQLMALAEQRQDRAQVGMLLGQAAGDLLGAEVGQTSTSARCRLRASTGRWSAIICGVTPSGSANTAA